MGKILFSPSGRIDPHNFMRGAYVLIAVSFLINLLPMVNVALGSSLKLLLLIAAYCWFALFIKRFHDGGKSGWMSLVPAIVFVIGYMILNSLLAPLFASEINQTMKEAIAEAGSVSEMFAVTAAMSQEYGEPLAKKLALPGSVLFALLSFGIAFVFNKVIKHEPRDNEYGPA